jgi:ubiquinone/menaquinone biosynthesis C-methylase UbiE
MATELAAPPLQRPALNRHARIRDYFERCWPDYRWIWGSHRHGGMHVGLCGGGRGHDESVLHTNRVLADAADVREGDVVLDAGCGVGGSALWLAQHRGARVHGVTLVPSQATFARRTAHAAGLSHLVSFEIADYLESGYPDESFDIVWGLESVCYAPDKATFLHEAFRLLRPGGRLVVADGFLSRPPRDAAEARLVRAWCNGWVVPDVGTIDEFLADAHAAGFDGVRAVDMTQATIGSSRRMYLVGVIAFGPARLLELCGIGHPVRTGSVRSAVLQRRVRRIGLGMYAVVMARKPGGAIPGDEGAG